MDTITIILRSDNKAFPVLKGSTSLETARGWGARYLRQGEQHTYEEFEIYNMIENAKIVSIDGRDCTGGNVWKIEATVNDKQAIFDLREEYLLEILQESSVINGIIQCPLVLISRNQFVMREGKWHKDYLRSVDIKNMKKITNKNLQIGYLYSLDNENWHVYLGKCADKLVFVQWYPWSKEYGGWIDQRKSQGFRFEKPTTYNFFKKIIDNVEKQLNEYSAQAKSGSNYHATYVTGYTSSLKLLEALQADYHKQLKYKGNKPT